MNRKNVDKWLRNEAENIKKESEKIEIKIKKLMKNEDLSSLDKINQYNIQLKELNSAINKLYEMIGRINEIEDVVE
jgi:hypothetical protein